MGEYVSTENVPVIGPDTYDESTKTQAITYAEAKLEADVNDGQTIENTEDIHEFAVNSYASFILASGPEDPADAKSGDFADSGDDVSEFANSLREMYRSARSSILTADEDASSASSHVEMGGTR